MTAQTNIRSLSAWIIMQMIRLYRLVPKGQQRCIYHPTCSAYGLEAVRLHGAIRGGWLAVRRVGRCHPWGRGGLDPVPVRHDHSSTAEHRPTEQEHQGTSRELVLTEE